MLERNVRSNGQFQKNPSPLLPLFLSSVDKMLAAWNAVIYVDDFMPVDAGWHRGVSGPVA
jgi:hypothetical protein